MEIFSGDFKDIFYDEEAEKRKEKRKERRDELQKAKIPDDYSPNQREINWFLVSPKVGCLFMVSWIHGSRTDLSKLVRDLFVIRVRSQISIFHRSGPRLMTFSEDRPVMVHESIVFTKPRPDSIRLIGRSFRSKFPMDPLVLNLFYGFLLFDLVK